VYGAVGVSAGGGFAGGFGLLRRQSVNKKSVDAAKQKQD
jgi:hypothetical protein